MLGVCAHALPGAGLALRGLAIVGDVDLEAAQRQVATEALELDLAVAVGGAGADGCVAKLVQVPAWRVLLPERVALAIRQPSISLGGQVGAAGERAFRAVMNSGPTVGWPRSFR